MALEARGISFSYGPIQALEDVDFVLERGETVALVGDNGAGKSTLIKILAGVLQPDTGTITVDGEGTGFRDPAAARDAGIETLYQDLSLLENLDVTMNFFVGREVSNRFGFLHFREMRRRTRDLIHRYSLREVNTETTVSQLSGGQRQIVAIARAIGFGSEYIILDEPTSALSPVAAEEVLAMVRQLASQDFGVVVITHNVQHAFEVADRIVVMRLGRIAGVRKTAETDPSEVVSLIVGADVTQPHGEGAAEVSPESGLGHTVTTRDERGL